MLVPKRLSICGFRGYRDQTEFDFRRPAVVLFGENHSGKSSTLNAIEWCLFGDDCLGKQTGIRERIGWVVPNQHQPAPEAVVELELANNAGSYLVRRRWAKNGKRAAVQELQVQLPDGQVLTGGEAERHLVSLRQAEFRDFLTTVYQHQEAIRAVLTQEPKDRNDAIDRLLGLAVHRNLLDALDRARVSERFKAMSQKFEQFERQLQTALATREHDLGELRFAAAQSGIPESQQGPAGGLTAARSVHQQLGLFAQEAELKPEPVRLPESWTGLADFETAARKRIAWLRAEMPCVRQQQELFQKQTSLLGWKTKWEHMLANAEAVGRNTRELDREYGGRQRVDSDLTALDRAIADEEGHLRTTNRRAALIREAIGYLADLPSPDCSESCPLCRQAAHGLLPSLQAEWEEELRQSVQAITTQIETLQSQKKKLQAVQRRYIDLNRLLEQALQEKARLREEIAGRPDSDPGDTDDPLAALNREINALTRRAEAIQEAIAQKVQRLDEIECGLEKVRRIREILVKEEKSRALDQIQQTLAFLELESLRDRAAQWVTDGEAIQTAVAAAAREEATERLAEAEQAIDEFFRQLTRHPAVRRIRLQVTEARQRNHYAVTDDVGQDLTPILSQGDLNALALAIFLGLATAGRNHGAFGFVMLDDPSQSLGSGHKKALVEVLDHIAREKHVLLATMDAEFRELLHRGFTHGRHEYVLGNWSVESGPTLMPGSAP